ncbi:MAG: YaeQ family protein [Acidimicrobiia bacterium]|nr:YaeQ family protein [Acidimicrobiia bacterium]
MALTATVFNFDIDLTDTDRGCYETLALRVAQHPSESDEYLIARVLAYCLEYAEGITFSSGVSSPDDPTISVRDLTGTIHLWVEIGLPEPARLHKASKAAQRVAVYTHKVPGQWLRQIAGERIHRAGAIDFFEFDRAFVAALVARLDRRMALSLSIADGHILVATGDDVLETDLARKSLTSAIT